MTRHEIITKIGQTFYTTNTETGEFNYHRALGSAKYHDLQDIFPTELKLAKNHIPETVDLRFEDPAKKLTILVETKRSFTDADKQQLDGYCWGESQFKPQNHIISMLIDTDDTNRIKIFNDGELLPDTDLNAFEYYTTLYDKHINDRTKVLKATNLLNNLLHKAHIEPRDRAQFIGSCLIAMRTGFKADAFIADNPKIAVKTILDGLTNTLDTLLNTTEINANGKIEILKRVLSKQDIRDIKLDNLLEIFHVLDTELIPYIKQNTGTGEDLLNLFFTTFNKYIGKADKNQAFTPPHVASFMSKLVHLTPDSKLLDPTCGSGVFLVQGMERMFEKTYDVDKYNAIKTNQLFGIEADENAYGLATTNMLLHQAGTANLVCKSLFDLGQGIQDKHIDTVLMNPPFNGTKVPDQPIIVGNKTFEPCPVDDKGIDATKGLYFVYFTAENVGHGYLATILPTSCTSVAKSEKENSIIKYKRLMMAHHTLEAVFSLPNEIFYPGASASACIMLWHLGVPHDPEKVTFFGYYKDDGFVKQKNLGRVESVDGRDTEKQGLKLFNESQASTISVLHKVNYRDEGLAEAYLPTDYSKLTEKTFEQAVRAFLAFKIIHGEDEE